MFAVITVLFVFAWGCECFDDGGRILNGEDADSADYSYYGVIVSKNKIFLDMDSRQLVNTHCGASLVSSKYFLTAYHCFIKYSDPCHWVIIVGMADRCTYRGPITVYTVEKIIPYPKVELGHKKKKHDIALVMIKEDINDIKPIQLPSSPPAVNENGEVIGFGLIRIDRPTGNLKDLTCVLQRARQRVPDQSRCKTPNEEIVAAFCVIDPFHKNASACRGDSGGPWITQRESVPTLLGVSSFGDVRCLPFTYDDHYTNVFPYVSWIRRIIETPPDLHTVPTSSSSGISGATYETTSNNFGNTHATSCNNLGHFAPKYPTPQGPYDFGVRGSFLMTARRIGDHATHFKIPIKNIDFTVVDKSQSIPRRLLKRTTRDSKTLSTSKHHDRKQVDHPRGRNKKKTHIGGTYKRSKAQSQR